MTTAEVQLDTGSIKEWNLPPGWEAFESEKDNRVYYWNKKTGITTWNFPDKEAKEHGSMVRRHTYENIPRSSSYMNNSVTPPLQPNIAISPLQSKHAISPFQSKHTDTYTVADRRSKEMASMVTDSNPNGLQSSPSQTVTGSVSVSPSTRRSYENVDVVPGTFPQSYIPKPLPHTQSALLGTNPQPCMLPNYMEAVEIPPQPPIRSHSFAGLSLSNHTLLSPIPLGPQHNPLLEREWRCGVTTPTSVEQQVSTTGSKFGIEGQQKQDQESSPVGQGETDMRPTPPTVPLRAFQRMSCREIMSRCLRDGSAAAVSNNSAAEESQTQVITLTDASNTTTAAAVTSFYDSTMYSKLDQTGRPSVEGLSITHPYEVASSPAELDPAYAEIRKVKQQHLEEQDVGEADDHGYSRVRLHPRGQSSSSLITNFPATGDDEVDYVPLDSISGTSSTCGTDLDYDLPSNSYRLKSLNLVLNETGPLSPSGLASPHLDYAKLGFTKEACMLRSGVSLKRNQRESSCSFARMEGEEEMEGQGRQSKAGGSISSGEEEAEEEERSEGTGEEPTNKCGKSPNETTSACSGGLDDGTGHFKMVIPPSQRPSWITYQRRPHAYEDIMGASQEDLDWDELDMGGGMEKWAGSASCELIKVADDSLPKQARERVLHHQYEEVAVGQSTGAERSEGNLPKGWVCMRDGKQQRDYFWHIPSGKTQYIHPNFTGGKDVMTVETPSDQDASVPPSYQAQPFPAQYLGYLPVEEQQLMPGQCVKVVHACISKMATLLTSTEHIKSHKEVLLAVKGLELHWLHPQGHAPIFVQPINRIRVWGIGLEDDRDFGYVSRDLTTRKHLCHVFRCSLPARAVAHLLLESHQYDRHRAHHARRKFTTPTSHTKELGVGAGRGKGPRLSLHERYERITCTYMGSCDVNSSQGMDTINGAVDKLYKNKVLWQEVTVDVATSSVTICDKSGRVLGDHRVRFLCFLGIARDDRFCGYILDSGEIKGEHCYRFHGFTKEPNTDKLCLVLHNAYLARYRRVMQSQAVRDAGTQDKQNLAGRDKFKSKSSSASLFGRLGSLKKSKVSSPSSPSSPSSSPAPEPAAATAEEGKSFIVQYLGCMPVSKTAGLDTVRPMVQDLASACSARSSHLVEFTASPSGLAIADSCTTSKITSSSPPSLLRKEFPVQNITYVVKIRNYFAFVARDGNKHVCHAFFENKVDAGTIVSTIQHMLAPAAASQ